MFVKHVLRRGSRRAEKNHGYRLLVAELFVVELMIQDYAGLTIYRPNNLTTWQPNN